MFNLDEAIGQWRVNMACGGACSKSDLDELESHVRDQVDHLLSANLSHEEALSVALHRIGNPDALRAEYAKVNSAGLWQERLLWMLVGILGYWLIGAMASGMSAVCTLGGILVGVHGGTLGAVQAGSWALVFGCLVWLCLTRRHAVARWVAAHVIGRPRGRYAMAIGAMLGVMLVGRLAGNLSPVLIARWVGLGEYGRMAMVKGYADIGTGLILPVATAVIAAWLLRGRERRGTALAA